MPSSKELKQHLQAAVKEAQDPKGAVDWSKLIAILGPVIKVIVDSLLADSLKAGIKKGMKAKGADDDACSLAAQAHESLAMSVEALQAQVQFCESLCAYLQGGGGDEGEGDG